MNLLQIVPRLPPSICGVGDYSWLLARALREQHGIETRFLVVDPSWQPADGEPEFPFERVAADRREATNQIERLAQPSNAVLLQYSGYGFSKRGAPLWLLAALRALRLRRPRLRLITMFHELYATGPIFRSSFWFSHAQRWITRSIARLSHCAHTNRQASARWLEAAAPSLRGRITAMPVFSNLGERPDAPPPSQRPAQLVIFGHQVADGAEFWASFESLVEKLGAARVIVLNRPLRAPAAWPSRIPVESSGILEPKAISAILQSARWGCLNYPPAFLGKSGVLAAMLAHGVVPTLLDESDALSEGLEWSKHAIAASHPDAAANAAALDRISAHGKDWYAGHNIAATAASYANHLQSSGKPVQQM